jgi:hypothetical protein
MSTQGIEALATSLRAHKATEEPKAAAALEENGHFQIVMDPNSTEGDIEMTKGPNGRLTLRFSEATLNALFKAMLELETTLAGDHQLLREWIRDLSGKSRDSKYWQAGVVLASAIAGGGVGIGAGFASGSLSEALKSAGNMLSKGGDVATPFFHAHQEYLKLGEDLTKGDRSRTTELEQKAFQMLSKLKQADEESHRLYSQSRKGE